eukprot:TRINITY_DN5730_c1_g1_i1.p1 TRINITY_DN5730_c1_g1~~TRINITY_DN5730_c1_g1_i1.p1  ORF type:complete len:236 (-),score=76.41 TRINITY_DN5730_c1_g1_i1:85-792(-)
MQPDSTKVTSSPSSSTTTSSSNSTSTNNNAQDENELPRDAKIISNILQSMGVYEDEYQPRVVNQLLEFMYRYVTEVVGEGIGYSEHAGRSQLDLSDIRLAIQSRVHHSFTQPPPRELIVSLAQLKNSLPLGPIPTRFGVHLPSDEFCMIAPNYQVDPKKTAEEETSSYKPSDSDESKAAQIPQIPTKKADKQIPININSNNMTNTTTTTPTTTTTTTPINNNNTTTTTTTMMMQP